MKKGDRINLKLNIVSLCLSGIALIISGMSIYYSGFYKSHEVFVSVVGSNQSSDFKSLDLHLVAHNRGNTFATILTMDVTYSWGDPYNEFMFDKEGNRMWDLVYSPITLAPGEQMSIKLESKNDGFLKEDDFVAKPRKKLNIKGRHYYRVDLKVHFLDKSGRKGSQNIPIGKLFFDDIGPEELSIEQITCKLEPSGVQNSGRSVMRPIKRVATKADSITYDSLTRLYPGDSLKVRELFREIDNRRFIQSIPKSLPDYYTENP